MMKPENETGNMEYKLKWIDKDLDRIERPRGGCHNH